MIFYGVLLGAVLGAAFAIEKLCSHVPPRFARAFGSRTHRASMHQPVDIMPPHDNGCFTLQAAAHTVVAAKHFYCDGYGEIFF